MTNKCVVHLFFNCNVWTAKTFFYFILCIFTELYQKIWFWLKLDWNYRIFIRNEKICDLLFFLRSSLCDVSYECGRRSSCWSKHKNWDIVFLSLPAVTKNSCRYKYISRAQSTPKPLLRSWCMEMTVYSVKYQLIHLSPESDS